MPIIRLLDDMVGAVVDVLKLVGYFLVGVIGVTIPLYGIAKLFDLIVYIFY
ncbi:hypothetical protein [Planococcus sp. S3-L1]|uniref:hypothetical protein n=1 Tax=Planococcus sp. S3-L1 TaxID=3046200 RepID=UPI0024B9C7DF|nr:hypothetical protein [Planococcus sp. S3-L1]MDJ0333591.1 hypothetical protein [Planococcus sp. S3-L1]